MLRTKLFTGVSSLAASRTATNRAFGSSARRLNKPPPPAPGILKSTFKTVGYGSLAVALCSIGYISFKVWRESYPKQQEKQAPTFPDGMKRKTLVILGSGWGSISLLKKLDTTLYNVVVVSPRNYFLFTPLLPSCPTGTVEVRSIIEPVRAITRRCPGEVIYLEAEATDIDPANHRITIKQSTTVHSGHSGKDSSSAKPSLSEDIVTSLNYDYLVVGVGAQPSTFGLPGVAEHSTFLKEVSDSMKIRRRLMDVIEAANILPKDDPERKRLCHIVVCGGGPTGVEVAGELQDYIDQDLKSWMPEIASDLKITLVEAMPNVLSMFNKKLVEYTSQVMQDTNINLLCSHYVKKVTDKTVYAVSKEDPSELSEIPYGMLIWATGNAKRPIITNLSSKIEEQKNAKKGLLIDERLLVDGTDNIWALGDCTFTKYAPTAQVAFQEGIFLAEHFHRLHEIESLKYKVNNSKPEDRVERYRKKLTRVQSNLPVFEYNYQGSLAYIGSERAVADLVWGDWSNVSTGGPFTFLLWRSAYIYMCLSVKNQILVCFDWLKVAWFGRDISKE
ncbi:hypothetical protein FT663_05338 [Candidozyma haemuli var. vulneris]|uniref:NADH:ubiquinone reductase (non-electrogenic) n=1 Tax=Candidozyma haemuli TaxID=45357 RepID=A0A2V1AZ13_9ASCO|nr:hypothetical protein CXQ85_005165 [[Candida] haemuloni]KAF3985277.1 hypothetical protein FT662_05241 [[Candida] haemuloni var. vulneris]KAF3985351.1 hypothetical protein FT663_05338 [[Candida] haemuloni var. vulneris]PVH22593.1 hypothetical protein CXQ85_005165 [[Candida] haemuloni]